MEQDDQTLLERENSSDDYERRENLWDEAWPTSSQAGDQHPLEEPDNLDEELPFPDAVGTTDPIEAVRDAEPYMAPTDPPVLPGGTEAIHVATGFGESAEEEAMHDEPLLSDADILDEVTLLLRQDSLTSKYPLEVDVYEGIVRLMGQVPSVEDANYASAIIGELPEVIDVVDETTIIPTASE